VSKPSNNAKQAVDLTGSRIRRAPPKPERQIVRRSSEAEIFFGVTGVMLTAVALGIVVIGIGVVTAYKAVTAPSMAFGQCYSAGGSDCVLDGGTIYVNREKTAIAGIKAPRIQSAACPAERQRGIAAAVRLGEMLQSGEVTIGPPSLNTMGREVRAVQVKGQDVGRRMIAAGLARRAEDERDWC